MIRQNSQFKINYTPSIRAFARKPSQFDRPNANRYPTQPIPHSKLPKVQKNAHSTIN